MWGILYLEYTAGSWNLLRQKTITALVECSRMSNPLLNDRLLSFMLQLKSYLKGSNEPPVTPFMFSLAWAAWGDSSQLTEKPSPALSALKLHHTFLLSPVKIINSCRRIDSQYVAYLFTSFISRTGWIQSNFCGDKRATTNTIYFRLRIRECAYRCSSGDGSSTWSHSTRMWSSLTINGSWSMLATTVHRDTH